MKQIKLTQNQFALVDNEDFEWLNQWKWYAYKTNYSYYVRRNGYNKGKQITICMHRVVVKAKKYQEVDHKDRNGLNNCKANLRICTRQQNRMNSVGWGSSIFKGVSWHKHRKRWSARIGANGKLKYMGLFDKEIEAAKAYNEEATKQFGAFARLNIFTRESKNVKIITNTTNVNSGNSGEKNETNVE